MIITTLSDPQLLSSVRRAARPDEDVATRPGALDALRFGFPRAAIGSERDLGGSVAGPTGDLPTLSLDGKLLATWEDERRWGGPDVPPERTDYIAYRIRAWLRTTGGAPTWIDLQLRNLGRAAGRALPLSFRGVARRVLECPARYPDLGSLAGVVGLSAGALKARFRRRDLASPHVYLRWLRSLAVAQVLADPGVSTVVAAHRLGISSGGNLCRGVLDTTGFRPKELRRPEIRTGLLTTMVGKLLDQEALAAWDDLDGLFYEVA
jgi:AraC-like DNA-binding protein